jgi:CRP/FNR family cyclic AMP-dependent transcriptional regulator
MKLRGSENSAIVEILQKTPLWSSLDAKELKVVAESFKEVRFESGDVIVRKGKTGCGFFLVLDGMVEVRAEGRALSKLGPGQFFGEMALLDDQPRSADVVALEPSRCLGLTPWSFKPMIFHHPKIALKLMQELAHRLRVTNQALSE